MGITLVRGAVLRVPISSGGRLPYEYGKVPPGSNFPQDRIFIIPQLAKGLDKSQLLVVDLSY